jgi:DNA-binding MarR family transcriptional regulator
MNAQAIDDFRSFNRFYTAVIGLLDKHILNSSYTLAEVRIMYELYHGRNKTASHLIQSLSIDKGYLSRVLQQFEKAKLVKRQRSSEDTRVVRVSLTAEGRRVFQQLDKASSEQVSSILTEIPAKDLNVLLGCMAEIRRILSPKTTQTANDETRG